MRLNTRLAVLALIILVVPVLMLSCKKAEKIELAYRLNKGESYGVKATVKQHLSQTIRDITQETDQEMSFRFRFDVTDVSPEGIITGDMIYDSVYVSMDGPMGKVEYDSEVPFTTENPMMKPFAMLKGRGFTISMTPRGDVTSVAGAEELIEDMLTEMAVGQSPMGRAMKKQLTDQFGGKAFEDMLERSMAIFPDHPVAVGDSWTTNFAISKGVPATFNNTMKLVERKNGIAKIEVTSTVTANPDADFLNAGGIQMKYSVSGTQKGSMDIIEESGWIDYATLRQDLTGEITFEGSPAVPGGINWPISITTDTVMVRMDPSM